MTRAPETVKAERAKARILIVDDHPIVREGLRLRISSQSDMQVYGEAASVAEALACFRKDPPDLVIVDISLGDGSGLDLIQRLKAHGYLAKILVLSAHDDTLYAERALKAGAHGYIGKSEAQSNILIALRVVLEGGCYLRPELTRRLIGRALGAPVAAPTSPVEGLSNREMQVFQLIGQGSNTRAIADQLHLSPHTVESHREKIKAKLGLNNALELQRAAIQWMLTQERRD